MVEYIDQQIQSLSWQVTDGTSGNNIIAGSDKSISLWRLQDKLANPDQLPIVESTSELIPSKAVRVRLIGIHAFSAFSNGTVMIHSMGSEREASDCLKLLAESHELHETYKCNDMTFCPQSNSVITCGNDGCLSTFNVDRPQKVDRHAYSGTALKCMDLISPNEVICGNLNGSLKHFDIRVKNCVGSYTNQSFSALLCVQKNPHVNHLATGGNDQGSIIIYDLRNTNSALAEISAHSAAVTNIRYRPNDPNVIYSSSVDGDLFRWSLNTQFLVNHVPKKVESIGTAGDPWSIVSFDVNEAGDIVYTTDHGAIYYRAKF